MKTPLDDFNFDSYTVKGSFAGIYVEAHHKTLPISFARKYEASLKLITKTEEKITDVTLRLCRDILKSSVTGILNLSSDRKIQPGGWDKEKESWFVLNENNEKIYE